MGRVRILAIDPGSIELGWAILDGDNLISWGLCCAVGRYEQRFPFIIQTLSQVYDTFKPECVACERAIRFEDRRIASLEVVVTAIRRWAKSCKLPISLYSPAEWKLSVIGFSQASKEQVGRTMVLLYKSQLREDISEHITDAIAIGLHHAGIQKWEIMGLIPRH